MSSLSRSLLTQKCFALLRENRLNRKTLPLRSATSGTCAKVCTTFVSFATKGRQTFCSVPLYALRRGRVFLKRATKLRVKARTSARLSALRALSCQANWINLVCVCCCLIVFFFEILSTALARYSLVLLWSSLRALSVMSPLNRLHAHSASRLSKHSCLLWISTATHSSITVALKVVKITSSKSWAVDRIRKIAYFRLLINCLARTHQFDTQIRRIILQQLFKLMPQRYKQ